MFLPLREFLKKRVRSYGIDKKLFRAKISSLWKEVVEKMYGKKISGQTRVLSFQNNILSVGLLDSVFALKVKKAEKKIIAVLNKKLGGEKIKKIFFKT
jgi:hypothetical protein